jgi:hypothetical protein
MLEPQVFALMLKTVPDASCMELIVNAAVPELVSAKTSAALLVLTAW